MILRKLSPRNRQWLFVGAALSLCAIVSHVTPRVCFRHTRKKAIPLRNRECGVSDRSNASIIYHERGLNYSLLTSNKEIVDLLENLQQIEVGSNVALTDVFHNFPREIMLTYPSFVIHEPHFLSENDRNIFLKNPRNRANLAPRPREKLRGVIRLFDNGSTHASYDCGWNSDLKSYGNRIVDIGATFEMFCPIMVPGGDSFQHFLDGVLPKIVQVLPFLRLSHVKLMLPPARDNIIKEMLLRMNIPQDQIVEHRSGFKAVSRELNTCITPPLHPLLWQAARELLSPDPSHADDGHVDETYVLLLTRARHHNPGRNIVNFHAVTAFLRRRYAGILRVFRGGYTLGESSALFGKVRLVIGVHGGAFYNIVFCRSDTTIVEV